MCKVQFGASAVAVFAARAVSGCYSAAMLDQPTLRQSTPRHATYSDDEQILRISYLNDNPPESRPQISIEPRTSAWIQKNSWFQPKSEDFDPEMHEEAIRYARRMERRFCAKDRDDEIGSVDYFTEIDRHMRRKFPDTFSAQSTPSRLRTH